MGKKAVLIILGILGLIGIASLNDSPSTSVTQQDEHYQLPIGSIYDASKQPEAHTPETVEPKPQQNCNPNYSGCLLPNASDYDCAGGSGNGPYYTGTVQVLGYDEYRLDRDGNGIGCD